MEIVALASLSSVLMLMVVLVSWRSLGWPILVDAIVGEERTKDEGDKEHFFGERMRQILLNIEDGHRMETI